MFERKIKLKINAEECKLLRDLLISLTNELYSEFKEFFPRKQSGVFC